MGGLRAVIILHPDFQGGARGIETAKNFADYLLNGQREMIRAAEQSGEAPEVLNQVRKHTKAFKIVIRSIDEEII